MALSDPEIKTLYQQAKQYEIAGDGNSLKLALGIYDNIIAAAPEPFYYSRRSWLKYSIYRVTGDLIDSAIEDINRAIELDPGRGSYYHQRGNFLLVKTRPDYSDYPKTAKKAAGDFNECLKREPTYIHAWLELISLEITLGNYDEAIGLYGECKFLSMGGEEKLYRSLLGSVALILAGDKPAKEDMKELYDQSVKPSAVSFCVHRICVYVGIVWQDERINGLHESITEIFSLLIGHYESWEDKVNIYENMSFTREAAAALEKHVQANTKDSIAWQKLGEIYEKLGLLEKAAGAYGEAAISGGSAEDWKKSAGLLIKIGKLSEALQCLEKASEIEPADADVLNRRAEVLKKLGLFEEAFRVYHKIAEIAPEIEIVWNNCGQCLKRLKRYDDALLCFEKSLSINKNSMVALNELSSIMLSLGRYGEAAETYNRATDINPYLASAWYGKGKALLKLGRRAEALRCFEKTAGIDSRNISAWNYRCMLLDGFHRYEEALCAYDTALSIDPRHYVTWRNKSLLLRRLGRLSEALTSIDEALNLKKNYAAAWSDKGSILYSLGLYQKANAAFDNAVRSDPGLWNAWYQKGLVSGKLGGYEEELRCLNMAAQLNPSSDKIWSEIGDTLKKLARNREAASAYKKALSLNAGNEAALLYKKQSGTKIINTAAFILIAATLVILLIKLAAGLGR